MFEVNRRLTLPTTHSHYRMVPPWFRRALHPCFLFRPDTFVRAVWRKLRARPRSCVVRTAWGDPLEIDPREFIGAQVYLRGVHELPVCEVLWRLSRPGDRVVDVGANIGLMTSLLSQRVGFGGRVFSFEPHPALFPRLRQNARRWQRPQVQVFDRAVSNRTGSNRLFETDAFPHNSGTAGLTNRSEQHRSFEVRTVCLDHALPPDDYGVLKIDVEGHEHEVLSGSTDALDLGRFRDVVLESTATYPSAAHRLLLAYGYYVFEIGAAFNGPKLLAAGRRRAEQGTADYLATLDPQRAQELIASKGWNVLRPGITAPTSKTLP